MPGSPAPPSQAALAAGGFDRLPPSALRWRCDPSVFPFETTEEIEGIDTVIGQAAAVEALRFGLECFAPGQHVFVRGLTGTGRMTLIRRLLEETVPACRLAPDRVYIHNFDDPVRPRLLTLPRGRGIPFARAMDAVVSFIRTDLAGAVGSDAFKARIKALERSTEERVRALAGPIDAEMEQAGLALVTIQTGHISRPAILPRIRGQPVTPEQLELERQKGAVSQEAYDRMAQAAETFRARVDALGEATSKMMEEHIRASHQLLEAEVRAILEPLFRGVERDFPQDEVRAFLETIGRDIVTNRLAELQGEGEFAGRYRVNPIVAHPPSEGCPVVVECAPTLSNLIGVIERSVIGEEAAPPDHMSIRGGSILRADGGYLILEAREVLSEPGAWRALMRTLRTERVETTPPEMPWFLGTMPLKPEPIDVKLKVVLVGDPGLFFLLDEYDPDFAQLFKVLAEFDDVLPRDDQGLVNYARVLKRIAKEDGLPAFSREAVAALAEHGARIASQRDRLTARFSRLADIGREAAFLASKSGRTVVSGDDVRETVRRTKDRAGLSSRKFREMLIDGTIRLQTTGGAVGQMNGLAIMHAGPITYGFPARITASIGAGSAGVIDIEMESSLSGAIHTKGFHILRGLLRNLLRTDHPLAFDASIAFEQSYGGIDGDSASAAEICCLLSALTVLPIRQDLAMTGSIDQLGSVNAIGGVNEKIEGFFDVCREVGFSGSQGVIIPSANAGDLMLRHDVVEACAEGKFSVYQVGDILGAIALLFGMPAGDPADASLGEGTVLGRARIRAHAFWKMVGPAMAHSRKAGASTPGESEG
jgi:ATP-dependent Lon protease